MWWRCDENSVGEVVDFLLPHPRLKTRGEYDTTLHAGQYPNPLVSSLCHYFYLNDCDTGLKSPLEVGLSIEWYFIVPISNLGQIGACLG